MIEKNLCFHFLDETSQYLDTLPVIFEWDFGDGNKIQAWETEHCFADYGIYYIKLIMIDTLTTDIQEVANYTLNIERIIQPYITLPDSIFHNQLVVFDSKESYFPNGTINEFIWTFSDGQKFVGPICERSFKKPGKYWVKLGYVATDERKNEVKKCSIIEFDVY
jgi:PKD repeat protein